MIIKEQNGVAVVDSDEVILTDTQSALDLIATVQYETGCRGIAVHKRAVAEELFDLSTRVLGEMLQKFVNYHTRFAVIGDFSKYESKALRDFIYESNSGRHIFFAGTEAEAVERLRA